MKVQVTQSDIDRGKKGDSCQCPVALAVARAAGTTSVYAFENLDPCIVVDGVEYYGVGSAFDFMQDFDSGKRMQPFEFELLPWA